jgi:hypothetical protein
MRTSIIMLLGLVAWGVCLAVARMVGGVSAPSRWTATVAFAVIWVAVAATNMWVGVTKAGYSVREELPIFLLIAAVPIALASLLKWKFL